MNSSIRTLLCCILIVNIVFAVAASSNAVTISFRQGVGGYTQAQDTWLPKQNPNTNYGTNPGLGAGRLGAANEEQVLLGFYGIFGNGVGQIPLGTTINSATLGVANTFVFNPPNASVHQMLIPWTDTVETWNSLTNGLDNSPGTEFDPTPSYSGSFGSTIVPVTSIVQAWSNGATNYGFAIRPTSSTGAFAFQSSEFGIASQRPILTIDYVAVPEPASTAAVVMVLGSTLWRLRRRGNRYSIN